MVFRALGWLVEPRGNDRRKKTPWGLNKTHSGREAGRWPRSAESWCGAAACYRTHGFLSAPPGPPEVEASHEQLSVPFPFHFPLAVGPQRGRTVAFLWARVTHSRCRGWHGAPVPEVRASASQGCTQPCPSSPEAAPVLLDVCPQPRQGPLGGINPRQGCSQPPPSSFRVGS